MAFVGVKTVETADELRDLLQQYEDGSSRYFLRWAHEVSGFEKTLPTVFPSPEGQLFNQERELRWKQQGQKFNILLLSAEDDEVGFSPINSEHKIQWTIQERNAYQYSATTTRFPKGIAENDIKLGQRYFINQKTSIVHFVALTVKEVA
uniref:Uncharacterized protein n=1 Tax=Cyanothece sp. (strain PCC 7425 / ATCC 29141) TaxID=395961 RepID=B8HZK7_CYAP4